LITKIKDSEAFTQKVGELIRKNIKRNAEWKSELLLHHGEIYSRMEANKKTIKFYIDELRSCQYYDRLTKEFL
jgi:hypothetical protein